MRIGGKKKSNIIFGLFIALFIAGGIAGAIVILRDGQQQDTPSKTAKGGVLSLDGDAKSDGDVLTKTQIECVPGGNDYYRTNSTLAIDPKNPDTMFVGVQYKGVYKSTDGGMSWRPSDSGIIGYSMESDPAKKCVGELGRIVFDPTNSRRLIVSRIDQPSRIDMAIGETAGLYESKDGGATWQQIIKDGMNAGGSRAIGIDPKSPNVIYFGINNTKPGFTVGGVVPSFDLNQTGVLYKTTDGGKSWAQTPTGADEGLQAIDLHIDGKNPSVLWLATQTLQPGTGKLAASQKGMLKSSNGGQSWAPTMGNYAVLDSAMSQHNSNHVFASVLSGERTLGTMYTTNGNNFQTSTKNIVFARFDPHDPTGLRLLGYTSFENPIGIYESKDGGRTWNIYAGAPPGITNTDKFGVQPNELVWHPVSKDILFMTGTGAHVWKSMNGGKSWGVVLSLEALGANKNKAGSTRSSKPAQ